MNDRVPWWRYTTTGRSRGISAIRDSMSSIGMWVDGSIVAADRSSGSRTSSRKTFGGVSCSIELSAWGEIGRTIGRPTQSG